eukprot:591964-Pleurochrysis_carterae.AAC.1
MLEVSVPWLSAGVGVDGWRAEYKLNAAGVDFHLTNVMCASYKRLKLRRGIGGLIRGLRLKESLHAAVFWKQRVDVRVAPVAFIPMTRLHEHANTCERSVRISIS